MAADPVRVLVFYDEKGWAWWHRAHQIRANLSSTVELDILQLGQPFDHRRYDLILLFDHNLLPHAGHTPRGKIIVGSSCPRLTPDAIATLRNEGCKAGMVNSLAVYRAFMDQGRIFCCQNGVDADFFHPAPRHPETPTACWVGNSQSIGNKGLDLIREACRRAGVPLLALDKAELGGEGTAWTQEEVRNRIYHRSTFYICASEFEGTPNPMLESLACGLTVISTRVGNAPEIIRDGENGYLVERSVDAIAAAIRKLKTGDAESQSRQARESILNGWTWKWRAPRYEAMFLELAAEIRAETPEKTAVPDSIPEAPRKTGFTGLANIPFLAPKDVERSLTTANLQVRAKALQTNPADFANVQGAALDCLRLGNYPLAIEFAACAAGMTRNYDEVNRDLGLQLRAWQRNQGVPPKRAAGGRGKIRIAMLTYNALAYTQQCVHALLTRTRHPLEIHIRDNASRDDTPRWLRELNHPHVHVELGDKNLGVPGGRNRLIEILRPVAGPDDFVVFLDNDMEVIEGWDDFFLDFFSTHPQVGAASAIGHRFVVDGEQRKLLPAPYETPAPVDVACGGYACWVRVPALFEIGGYDEELGLFWHEDDDFTVTALSKGIDVWAAPGAPVIHHGHKSGVALPGIAEGGSLKNQAYLVKKWKAMGMILPSGEVDRSAVAKRASTPCPAPIGFNIIGYVTSSTGLGVVARNTATLLARLGYPVSVLDVDIGLNRSGKELLPAALMADPGKPLPHAINMFHLNPFELGRFLAQSHPAIRLGDRMNVCVPFWELSRIPGNWVPVLESMDLVLAPTRFIQDALAAGLNGTPVRYYPQALVPPEGVAGDRRRWGIPPRALVFGFSFDFTSVFERKNPMGVIHAFLQAFSSRDDAVLVIKMNNASAQPTYGKIAAKLGSLAAGHPNLIFVNETLSYSDTLAMMACWDVYVSLHRAEGLGLGLMECMSMGKVAMATGWSGNMDYMHDANSILVRHKLVGVDPNSSYNFCLNGETDHVWADPDVNEAALWMKRLAEEPEFRRKLGERARSDMRLRHEESLKGEVFGQLEAFYEAWSYRRKDKPAWSPAPRKTTGLRVLFQNRPTASMAPGGDTVVMNHYRDHLQRKGVEVTVVHDESAKPGDYDLVHLFNLVLPQTIEPFARRAAEAGVPYVVEAFQENQSLYMAKSVAMYRLLLGYMQKGQDRNLLPRYLEILKMAGPVPTDTSAFTAQNAQVVICSSREEKDYLRSLHPSAHAVVCRHGADVDERDIGPELFEKAFGLRDFVLCVGRLETRKNQLALLAALEMDDVPLVFADGGICYSPDYAQACRLFRRRGKTLFTGRLSKEMLVSAYRAAKVHALPSWYELPGLVTLEAALNGCNVVATPHGGIREYMGEHCGYFEPDDLDSMRRAVLRALEPPKSAAPRLAAQAFTWEKAGGEVLKIYQRVLEGKPAEMAVPA